MEAERPNFFAGPYIERRGEVREESGWPAAALEDPNTRFLLARGTAQLVTTGREPRIAFVGRERPTVRAAGPDTMVLLGWFREARCVLVELSDAQQPELAPGTAFEELRPLAPLLPADEAGLLAYARALTIWRQRQRFCGVCGYATRPERAGHVICCTNPDVSHEFFPRIDPAIIVL